MKVLAIGAHPDDIEIFMYGLLCLLKKNNIEIFMIIATDGSLGGKTYNNLIQLRKYFFFIIVCCLAIMNRETGFLALFTWLIFNNNDYKKFIIKHLMKLKVWKSLPVKI